MTKIDQALERLGVPRSHYDAYCGTFVDGRALDRPGRFPAWRSFSGHQSDREGILRSYDGVPPCPACSAVQDKVLAVANSEHERNTHRSLRAWIVVSGMTVSSRCRCGLWWRATGPEATRRSLKVRDAEWMTEGREERPGAKGFSASLTEAKLADHLSWRIDEFFRIVSLRWAPVVQLLVFDFDLRRLLSAYERHELRRRLQVAPETARLPDFVRHLPDKVEEMKTCVRRVMTALPVPSLPFRSSPSGGVHLYVLIHPVELVRARQWAVALASAVVPEAFSSSARLARPCVLDQVVHPHSTQSLRLPLGYGSKLLNPSTLDPMFPGDSPQEQVRPALAWLAEASRAFPRLALPDIPAAFVAPLPLGGDPSQLRPGEVFGEFSPMPPGPPQVRAASRESGHAHGKARGQAAIVRVADPAQFTDEHWRLLLQASPDLRRLVEEVPDDRSNLDARVIGALGRMKLFGRPGCGQEQYAPLAFHILVTYWQGSKAREEGLGYVRSILRGQEAELLRRVRRSNGSSTSDPSQLHPGRVSGEFSPTSPPPGERAHEAGWDDLTQRARQHGLGVGIEWLTQVAQAVYAGALGGWRLSKARARRWLKGHDAPEPELQAALIRAAARVADPEPRRVGRPPGKRSKSAGQRPPGRPRNIAALPASEIAAYVARHGKRAVAEAAGVDRRTIADYASGRTAAPKRVADRLRRAFGLASEALHAPSRRVSDSRRRQRQRQAPRRTRDS